MWAFCRASVLQLVQCNYNFSKKLKYTEVFCFKIFFSYMNHNQILWSNIQLNDLIMNIIILEIWITKLCYFMCRWLWTRYDDGKFYYEGEWYVVLWHITMTIKTKLHTLNGICEFNLVKALIIIKISYPYWFCL